MAIVRQMPALYLRGSLANVTMATLTEEQKLHCGELTKFVANHPDMAKHKSQVIKELGSTIGADYRDDRSTAEQEYLIAVWRGVVNLFYHREYKFECKACSKSTYMTKRSVPKAIDRIQVPCPNCGCVKVVKAGATSLVEGSYITHDEYQASYRDLQTDLPECKSSIESTAGELRYGDSAKAVCDDPKQLAKFFGEFVWNYFRQQLRENSRVEHHKEPQEVIGRADDIIASEIISLCTRLKIDHHYCPETQPEDGWYSIKINGLQTPPEFSGDLVVLLEKANEHGIIVQLSDAEIRIRETPAAATIEAFVIRPEHVMVLDNSQSVSGGETDDGGFTINHISFKTIGAQRMDQENHVLVVEQADTMNVVYNKLPNGHCRTVCDLLLQRGESYETFQQKHHYDSPPRLQHIADHLGITNRAVKQHVQTIRHICLSNGLVLQ